MTRVPGSPRSMWPALVRLPVARQRLALLAIAIAFAAGCLADATLPDDVGARTPCVDTADCPEGHVCPVVEGTGVARCVPLARPACGNAVRDGEEQCDDGNWIDGDGCRADCTSERCGDGRVDAGEACDDGGASATCSAACTRVVCGDFQVETPEICDDGNAVGGDGCSADCQRLEFCGNDLVDPGEACDDANQVSGDGCRGDCAKVEACGDQVVDEGEACDDGNGNPSDACHLCSHPVWTPRVVTGLGAGAGDPLAIPLAFPSAVYDRHGRVVFSDGITHLFRIDDGAPGGPGGDRVVPLVGTGTFGYGGDEGPATGARIDSPFGFDLDEAGRIYLADTSNARVRLVDTEGVIHTLAGTGVAGFSGDDGPAVLAALDNPTDVAIDSAGNLFVAEYASCRVRKIEGAADPGSALIRTVAGGDCAAADAVHAHGLAVDSDDDLLIADPDRVVVWRLPSGASGPGASALDVVAGILDVVAGSTVEGPATSVALRRPMDVAADGGRIFIADPAQHRLFVVQDATLSYFAGTGTQGFAGDDGPAANALLAGPRRVFARGGRVLVGDTQNQRLREIDAAGTLRTVAGAAPTPRPLFAFGEAVAVDGAGDAYLADNSQAVLWQVTQGGAIRVVAGTGTPGYDGEDLPATSSRVSLIRSIAFDGTGGLLLTEPNGKRIRRVAPNGTLGTIAGTGQTTDGGLDGALAIQADLGAVGPVAVDPTSGLVWFAARPWPKVRRINADGTLSTPVGGDLEGFGGDGGSGSLALLRQPTDLAFTDDGVLVIADPDNQRVRSYDPGLDRVDTVAGTGGAGFNGDGIDAHLANLDRPSRVAVAADGAVLIADPDQHRVRRVGTDGVISTILGDGTPSLSGDGGASSAARVVEPQDLAVDRSPGSAVGDLVLSDLDEDLGVLRRVNGGVIDSVNLLLADGVGALDQGALATPSAIAPLAPGLPDVWLFATGHSGLLERVRFDATAPGGGTLDVVAGRPNGFVLGAAAVAGGDPFPASGEARARYLDHLGDACGLVFDGADAVYVADRAAGIVTRVRLVDLDDPGTWTVAIVAGAPGDRQHRDSDEGPARFVGPCGLALDASGAALYVADADDATVRRVDLASGATVTLFGVPGLAGLDDDLLDGPTALAQDESGALFVADTGNHRVRRLTLAGNSVVDVVDVLGTGEAASSGDGAPASTFPVQAPRGLAFDAHGNLLVSSTRAVRLVSADENGVVDGSGAVLTLYGAAPRAGFPEDSTFCLSGLHAPADGVVHVADACQGYLVELTRAP